MARRAQSLAQIVTLPAPKGGWNARDPMPAMKNDQAVILINMVPGPGGVDLRNGSAVHATGLGARVNSLMEYAGAGGGDKLFAAAGVKLFEVSSAGAVDPDNPVIGDLASDFFVHTMFANSGGSFLTACNGFDPVKQYDGTDWTAPSITGVDSEDLWFVHPHARRLWFIEKNSTRLWYLEADAIQGAASELDVGSALSLGGHLMAMASWTRDGGSGPDDLLVVASSKGELILYSGIDPDTEDWAKVGTFRIPPPIGRRCFIKFGADLAIVTSQGVLPLSSVLAAQGSEINSRAITNFVEGAFNQAYIVGGQLIGWQAVEYARKQLFIVNVPKVNGLDFEQYVMNSATKRWCKFTGWPASCWALMGDKLYFGTPDGRILVLTDDYLDDGQPIQFDALPAFYDYGNANQKFFKQARGLFTAARGTDPPFEMKVDYDLSPATVSQGDIPQGGSPWGSPWGSSWGPPVVSVSSFQSIVGYGVVGSPRLRGVSRSAVKWHQTTILFEVGGPF